MYYDIFPLDIVRASSDMHNNIKLDLIILTMKYNNILLFFNNFLLLIFNFIIILLEYFLQ